MHVQGISALVTGGASGLGLATAQALHAHGAHVTLADLNPAGEQAAATLGARAAFVRADVTHPDQVSLAIGVAQAQGPLRVVANCAGVGSVQRTLNREGVAHDLELFRKIITVNLLGTFNVLRLAAAAMAQLELDPSGSRGVIINTASVAAFDGQIGQAAYASSKAGVAGMTLPTARDLAPVGIRVVTIAPGIFDTPMLAGLSDKARQGLAASVVHPRRLGQPSEYAKLVCHIVDNDYLNGEVIRIDGSLRMAPK